MLPARGRMKPPKSARDKNLAEPEALIEISLEVNFRARTSISLFCCCTTRAAAARCRESIAFAW
jgi:hypothetical protein